MVSAPSLRDLLSSYSADRSMSVTEPRPSQRAHIPPVMLKLRRSLTVRPPRSMETAPAPLIEATLNECAVGLIDHPLRLRGDRVEHQRALARAGDAGEHRQPALRDLDADVLEVV